MPPETDAARRAELVAIAEAAEEYRQRYKLAWEDAEGFDLQGWAKPIAAFLSAVNPSTVLALLRALAAAEARVVDGIVSLNVACEFAGGVMNRQQEQIAQAEHERDALRNTVAALNLRGDAYLRRIEELERERDAARAERDEARETAKRLNRRCGTYEAGLAEKLEDARRAGPSLGRMFANAAATKLEAENAHLRTRVGAAGKLREKLGRIRAGLCATRVVAEGVLIYEVQLTVEEHRDIDVVNAAFDATATDATGREGGT